MNEYRRMVDEVELGGDWNFLRAHRTRLRLLKKPKEHVVGKAIIY